LNNDLQGIIQGFSARDAHQSRNPWVILIFMDLSVIIVNYKSRDKALASIRAVKESDTAGIEYEIIVVDNFSEDGIEEAVKAGHPDARFIQSGANLGMGKGNNLGIASSCGGMILVLNADTYLKRNTIKVLRSYLDEHSDTGIVGPKLLNPDGTLQYTCFRFPKIYMPILRRTFLGSYFSKQMGDFMMYNFDRQSAREVDWIMGSCMMFRKSLLEKIGGGFDGRFWMYFEDTDFCRRAWQAGCKVVYNPETTAIHDHGRGSAKYPWYFAPFKDKLARAHIISWLKYFWKWGVL